MFVHVVSFQPFQDRAGVGGFYWYPEQHLDAAKGFYRNEIARSDANNYIYRLLTVEVEAADPDAVTDELDGRIEDLEVYLPVLQERVPA